ncbi:MAG: DUF2782 domain-containing protein [Rhodocyclaceae bacterium]|jgi:hypothetical protein|nr:DUF2782 domain-containing protein [Rhodocyclaceae bacterium]
MRRLTLLSAFVIAAAAHAEKPADLQPLPDIPPPPLSVASDADLEPQVTITKRGEDKVEEYRVNGKLYMLKVTPPHGVPYYLVDDKGDGVMTRRDTIGADVKPPMWVIYRF